MKSVLFIAATLLALTPRALSQQVILNELFNSGSTNDEWIELLVLQDALDLRGWSIRDFSSGGGAQAPLNFTSDTLWSGLRQGTIIVIGRPEATTLTEDTDPSDYLLVVKSNNALYFNGTVFSLAGSSDAVQVRNAATTHVAGVSWGAANTASLPVPHVQFDAAVSSGSAIAFAGDSVLQIVDPARWSFNTASVSPGNGNGPANSAWISRLRRRADGSGRALVHPDTLQGGTTGSLTVTFHPDTSFAITGLRLIIPPAFGWSRTPDDLSSTGVTATLSVSGDTVSLDAPVFSADSAMITLDAVTAPESTAFYPIRVETRVGAYAPVASIPRVAVFGTPTAIGNVKPNDANGIPLRNGELVTIRGIITVGGEFGGPSYLQDNSGGIAVFGSALSSAAAVGDEVVVSGVVSPFNGLSELTVPLLHAILSSGNAVEPVVVNCAQASGDGAGGVEQYEGMLLRLNGITVTDTSNNPVATWAVAGSGTNFRLHDASGTLDCRIDNNVAIANTVAPSGAFDVIGVLSQFRSAIPFIGGYQVMPRVLSDIIASGPIIAAFPVETTILPTSLGITWQTLHPGTSYLRYGTTPALASGLVGNDSMLTSHTVVLTGLTPATVYYIRAFSVAGADTSAASVLIASTASPVQSSGTVNVYFNKSVYTAIANPIPAAGLQDLPARLIARINAAQRSIDAALYSLSSTPGDNIAAALLAAKQRGVAVRVICEADNRNTSAFSALANGGIPLIDDRFDPANNGAGLMHNKFFVFDGRGGAAESVWVWTGSWNPSFPGTFDDYQNAIELQDPALAGAYTIEFEEMWGSATQTPVAGVSRFGARKTDNTPHRFVIGGRRIESYFSPSDRTTSHIAATIGAAQHSVAVGTMTLTRSDLAARLTAAKAAGEKVRIILDNSTDSGSQFGALVAQGCDIHLKTGPGLFHHKYMIADAENPSWDAVTVTGSHNWSNAAENSNNENTVIIHDGVVANQYLQEFAARYYQFGGIDSITTGAAAENTVRPQAFALSQNYPNPFNPSTVIAYELPAPAHVSLTVCDILGREVARLVDARQPAGTYALRFEAHGLASGVYFCRLAAGPFHAVRKMLLVR